MFDEIGCVLVWIELQTHIRSIYVLNTYCKVLSKSTTSDYLAPTSPFATFGFTDDTQPSANHIQDLVSVRVNFALVRCVPRHRDNAYGHAIDPLRWPWLGGSGCNGKIAVQIQDKASDIDWHDLSSSVSTVATRFSPTKLMRPGRCPVFTWRTAFPVFTSNTVRFRPRPKKFNIRACETAISLPLANPGHRAWRWIAEEYSR